MVLLHVLKELGFQKIVVCHLDHTLRGRVSAADGQFVARQAQKLGCKLEQACAHTSDYAAQTKKSLELAARGLRQTFFEACAKRRRCSNLLLAHHADDQVETCLFNFLRGTGAAGLGGMRPVTTMGRLTVWRPLLGVTRAEIIRYQESRRIAHREDASNAETLHTRNKLRHGVIPAIEAVFGPSFSGAVLRAAEILREEEDWMSSLVPAPVKELSCKELRAMHPALRSRTVLRWLRAAGIPEAGRQETLRVLLLLEPDGSPAKVSLPGKSHARRRNGVLFLEKHTE